jgi:HK97 family phage portal protein
LKLPAISNILKYFGIKNSYIQTLPSLSRDDAWGNYLSGKGYAVSANTALKVAVVIRCVDVVAKTIASLGCHLQKETEQGKTKATNHPLYKILRMLPNPKTTSYEFWHLYIVNLMLSWGAFAKIERDQNGFIRGLWNIPTCRVTQQWNNLATDERYIDVTWSSGKPERLYEGEYMFTPGFRFRDETEPEDAIKIASEVLGLTMALNGYAKDYFENGSNMGGFIEYPNAVGMEAFHRFKDDWQKTYGGVMNQHKWAILEGGFKVNKMDSNPTDAQALESRKMQIEEVCRIWGVPPHKVFLLDRMTFNNVEQINIEYVQECLNPMSERLEQTIYKDLLTSKEQNKLSANFSTNKLLKGDTATRTSYYNTMRQNGVMSTNDIRDLEDMNRIPPELGGDEYYINGNMITLANAKGNLPKSMQKGGTQS